MDNKDIAELLRILGQPDFTFTKSEIDKAKGSSIYVILKGNGDIYIGATTTGLTRPLAPTHHIETEEGDQLFVWNVNGNVFQVEQELIQALSPKLNKSNLGSDPMGKNTCPSCEKEFKPKRDWQKFCSHSCSQRAYMKRNFVRVAL